MQIIVCLVRIFIAATIVPCGGHKPLPVHHHIADYIFWSIEINEVSQSQIENIVLSSVKPVLEAMGEGGVGGGGCGGVTGVAYFSTCHDQTQLNRACYFHFFGVLRASK